MQPFCNIPTASCLNSLVTVNDPCSPADIYAGQLDVMALYPDFAWSTADAITDERVKSLDEVKGWRWLAIQKVTEDLVNILAKNGMNVNRASGQYLTSGVADCLCTAPTVEEGLSVYQGLGAELKYCDLRTSLKRIHVSELYIYSKVDYPAGIDLLVKDNGYQYTVNVPNIVAGVNDVYQLTGRPHFVSEGKGIQFMIDMDTYPDLCTVTQHCSCSLKNQNIPFRMQTFDGYSWKWNDAKRYGYGLVAKFGATCNYDNVLCILAAHKSVAWLILYYMGYLMAEKTLNSTRLNLFTVFKREQAKEKSDKYMSLYMDKYNDVVQSLRHTLSDADQDCIICRGAKIKTNI